MRSVVRSFAKERFIPIPDPVPSFKVGSVHRVVFMDRDRLCAKCCQVENRQTHGLCLCLGPSLKNKVPFKHGDAVTISLHQLEVPLVVVTRFLETAHNPN